MAFPPSVHHLHLPRTKRHTRRAASPSLSPDEDELIPTQTQEQTQTQTQTQRKKGKGINAAAEDDRRVGTTDQVGIGGVVGGFGKEAGVRLDRDKRGEGRWEAEKGAIYFPGTISAEQECSDIPLEDVIQSSVQYAESLCLPYERDGLRDVITDILTEDLSPAGPSGTSKQPGWPHLDLDSQPKSRRDMYRGARVAVVQNPKGKMARCFVAFPTGKVGHQLNISPFMPATMAKSERRSRFRFAPTTTPLEEFTTPILQICSSDVVSTSRIDRDATALLVRLQTTTHLLNLHPLSSPASPISSTRTAQLSHVDTEFRHHIDLALDAETWSRALVVDAGGGVWLWWEEKESRGGRLEKVMKLRKVRGAVDEAEEGSWRVAFGTRPGTAIVVSAREAIIIDIDDPDHPTTNLVTLNGPTRRFIGMEKTAVARSSKWTVLCTTHEIFWIDEMGKGVPSLGWKHGYEGAEDIEIVVLPGVNKGECTTLIYTPSDPFITVFTTPKSGPLRFISQPYALSLDLPPESIPMMLTRLLISPNRHFSSLLGLSENGTLSYVPLRSTLPAPAEGQKPLEPIPASWDDTVSELAQNDDRMTFGTGDGWEEKAKVGSREVNLRWAWLAIGRDDDGSDSDGDSEAEELGVTHTDIEEEDEDADVPMVSDEEGNWDDDESEMGEERWLVPELFERYLREMEAPVENVMTIAELASDSLLPVEPESAKYGQEKKGNASKILPIPLHPSSIRPTLEALGKIDFSKHLTTLLHLHSFLPALSNSQPPLHDIDPLKLYELLCKSFSPSSARDKLATAQLVVSLFLSSKVISPEDFLPMPQSAHDQALEEEQAEAQRSDEVEQFVQAASRLTLDETRPGRVQFCILQPRVARASRNEEDGEEEWADEEGQDGERAAVEADLQSRTAKALMESWKVGEDPATWAWDDWNLDQGVTTTLPRATQTSQRAPPLPTIQTTRPIRPLPSLRTLSNLALPSPSTPDPHQFSHLVPPTLTTSHSLPSLNRLPAQARSSPPPGWDGAGSLDLGGAGQGQSQSQGPEWASTQVERGKFGGKLEKKKKSKKRLGGF